MTINERKQALYKLGAGEKDIDALLAYTWSVFSRVGDSDIEENDFSMFDWLIICDRAQKICEIQPSDEVFESAAGKIPVIYTYTDDDFEKLIREFVYKDKEIPGIKNMGASFVHGKTLRFIILSNKPYSGVPAGFFGLDEREWLDKSMIIRKHHECAHYYTKKFFGSSQNNLHDELIADFCGLYAAFGKYRADWFMKFFGLRFEIYTKGLSPEAAGIIEKLAFNVSKKAEEWSETDEFKVLDEAGIISNLAQKELLSYI